MAYGGGGGGEGDVDSLDEERASSSELIFTDYFEGETIIFLRRESLN